MRIIGGEFKGRNLLPPPGKSITRPITGAVKKSLFGMLGEDLTGQVVLDLYCGTGTMGIEALSRGAKRCYFAELDMNVVERLRRNLEDVRANKRGVVWRGDIEKNLPKWLTEVTDPVDVAFVDPPYATVREWDWPAVIGGIFEPISRLLADDGVVVLRHSGDVELPPQLGPLVIARQRWYGDMGLALLTKQLAGQEPEVGNPEQQQPS